MELVVDFWGIIFRLVGKCIMRWGHNEECRENLDEIGPSWHF